jgi:hypothetical protein
LGQIGLGWSWAGSGGALGLGGGPSKALDERAVNAATFAVVSLDHGRSSGLGGGGAASSGDRDGAEAKEVSGGGGAPDRELLTRSRLEEAHAYEDEGKGGCRNEVGGSRELLSPVLGASSWIGGSGRGGWQRGEEGEGLVGCWIERGDWLEEGGGEALGGWITGEIKGEWVDLHPKEDSGGGG